MRGNAPNKSDGSLQIRPNPAVTGEKEKRAKPKPESSRTLTRRRIPLPQMDSETWTCGRHTLAGVNSPPLADGGNERELWREAVHEEFRSTARIENQQQVGGLRGKCDVMGSLRY